ncbi:MAG: hypothetical protein MR011_06595 [Lachnospiraceae bacterium]|nr:hypothetical protein [Lachnospiraceae bacterium]
MKYDEEKIKAVFITKLNSLMTEKGYRTDSALLNELDGAITQSRFSDLRSGKKTPNLKDLITLSDHFNVSVESLISDTENNKHVTVYDDLRSFTDSELFYQLINLEQSDIIKFEYLFGVDDTYTRYRKDDIAVNFTSKSLQRALRKWVEYEEKFANDNGEYVKDLMLTIKNGLYKELLDITSPIPPDFYDEGLPFD